jgi:class 3 adenylate cyclase
VLSAGWVFLLPRVLGIAFALLDETKRAALLLADAIDVAARAGARVELARSYLDAARLLARPGEVFDGSAARRLARRARELAASLELHGVARAAAALEGEVPSGGGPAPSADGHLRERLVSIAVGKDSHAASDLGRWLHEFLVRSDPEAGLAVAPATEIVPSAVGDVVVLMTDMVGSTERIERDGPAAALEAMQRHNKILRRCLAGSRGTEVQHTGDGVFAVFLDAADALACAVAIQRSFAHDRGSGETPIQVRVGLAVGPVLYEEGRLFGAPVNAAARLCAAAGPSRILCTDTVRLRAAGAWAQARALEPIALKGFESPLPICEIDW